MSLGNNPQFCRQDKKKRTPGTRNPFTYTIKRLNVEVQVDGMLVPVSSAQWENDSSLKPGFY